MTTTYARFFVALALVFMAVRPAPAQNSDKWTPEEMQAGVKKQEFLRYAFAGHKMQVTNLFALTLDCIVPDGWAYEIVKQPEHGVAELKPNSFFPAYAADNPRFKCNSTKINSYTLIYTPTLGYKGPDIIVYLEIGPGGLAWETTVHFNVRPFPMATPSPKQGKS